MQWITPLRNALAEGVDTLSPIDVRPLSDAAAGAIFPMRVAAGFVGSLSALGLLLVLTGLYSSVSYATRSRTREMAIRAAHRSHSREYSLDRDQRRRGDSRLRNCDGPSSGDRCHSPAHRHSPRRRQPVGSCHVLCCWISFTRHRGGRGLPARPVRCQRRSIPRAESRNDHAPD